jgi:hypothetical protein
VKEPTPKAKESASVAIAPFSTLGDAKGRITIAALKIFLNLKTALKLLLLALVAR